MDDEMLVGMSFQLNQKIVYKDNILVSDHLRGEERREEERRVHPSITICQETHSKWFLPSNGGENINQNHGQAPHSKSHTKGKRICHITKCIMSLYPKKSYITSLRKIYYIYYWYCIDNAKIFCYWEPTLFGLPRRGMGKENKYIYYHFF